MTLYVPHVFPVPLCALHRFVDEMPNARLVWVEECGHVPHLEQPQEAAKAIFSFVRNGNPAKVISLTDAIVLHESHTIVGVITVWPPPWFKRGGRETKNIVEWW